MASTTQRSTLPQPAKYAMWHNETGLIVSMFSTVLPSEFVPVDNRHSMSPSDFKIPRLVTDDQIYLACYPRGNIFRSPLFSALPSIPEEIPALVERITNHGQAPQFIVKESTRTAWTSLEDGLLTVIDILIEKHHSTRLMPTLTCPRYPHQFGYRVAHPTQDIAISCARRARAAFHSLSAVVTFVLTLWLTEYEDTCFDAAFAVLAASNIPQVWIDHLRNSVVCNISLGARPGAFLDAYRTKWGPFIRKFCYARIPIWLVWGKIFDRQAEDPELRRMYFPPSQIVDATRHVPATFDTIVLPARATYYFPEQSLPLHSLRQPAAPAEVPSSSNWMHTSPPGSSRPDDGPQPQANRALGAVHAGSGQRAGESWDEFAARMEEKLERRKAMEMPQEKQKRESLEAYAREHGFSAKSTVYIWEDDENDSTFYRRTRLNKSEVEGNWDSFTECQRRYWSHCNEWDLCPQIPRFASTESAVAEQVRIEALDDEDDEDYSLLYSQQSQQGKKIRNEKLAEALLESVRIAVAQNEEPHDNWYHGTIMNLVEYLQKRHGFHAEFGQSWNPNVHGDKPLNKGQHAEAAKHLLHGATEVPTSVLISIVDFHNTAQNEKLSYSLLPAAWDLSRFLQVRPELRCDMRRIALESVTPKSGKGFLYILRPPRGSKDTSPWFIATTSATTVLLVYRSPWTTMTEICRGLLDLGIPFRTVITTTDPKVSHSYERSRGLGLRSRNFSPSLEDYKSYQQARDMVLQSSSGRAVRLRGGLAGRMASEVVTELAVLDGPNFADEVVGRHGGLFYMDDELTEKDSDIVMGVYRVADETGALSHQSWWPKISSWEAYNFYCGDQWSPAAESFYQDRLSSFQRGDFSLSTSKVWKVNFKLHRNTTNKILQGSERLAAEFIAKSSRVA